jgi:hypothetical protein
MAPLKTVMLNLFQHLAEDKHEILNQVQNDKVVFLEVLKIDSHIN